MAHVGFIGLGAMGGPMAANLASNGHVVTGYDTDEESRDRAAVTGVRIADSAKDAVQDVDFVVTMLPNGTIVSELLIGEGLLGAMRQAATLIDTSSIDVATSIQVHAEAEQLGLGVLDAPVSGGTAGARAGTLTFMVGGAALTLADAQQVLGSMGEKIVHVGGAGAGQAAKTCNQMLFGVTLKAVGEMFALATSLGLDHKTLWSVVTASTGDCRALRSFCPVPGVVEGVPAENDFVPGFASTLMLKDLRLALSAAADQNLELRLVESAAESYGELVEQWGIVDSSAVIKTVVAHNDEEVYA